MLRIAFCDDEPIMLEELFNVVKGYIDSKKVEFTADLFESGEEFVEKGVRFIAINNGIDSANQTDSDFTHF